MTVIHDQPAKRREFWVCGYRSGFGHLYATKQEAERKQAGYPDYLKMNVFPVIAAPSEQEIEAAIQAVCGEWCPLGGSLRQDVEAAIRKLLGGA